MNNSKLPFCPYCKARLWYAEAFLFKSHHFYKCKCCSKVGKVEVDSGIFKFLGLVEFLSIIVFALSMFAGGIYCFLGLGLILILFGGFYVVSPYKVRIVKIHDEDENFGGEKNSSYRYDDSERFGKDTDTEIYSN